MHANLEAIQNTIKAEDPTRLTAFAAEASADDANLTSPLLSHADLSAYNEYSGWYYGTPSSFGERLDALHAAQPERRIGITEYGAGASIHQHTEWPGTPAGSAQRPVPHPEEYQAYYHSAAVAADPGARRGCGARSCGTCSTSPATSATKAIAPASTTRAS